MCNNCKCGGNENMKIRVRYLDGAKRMEKTTKGNWIDVYAYEDKFVPEGERAMINLGFALELPEGYEGHLAPRSSTFKTWGVIQTNSVGVVDDTYIGDNDIWHMPVYSLRGDYVMDKTTGDISAIDDVIINTNYHGKDLKQMFSDKFIFGTFIQKGDKIGQFRIMEVMPNFDFVEAESFGHEARGGFGTSGVK